jgi:predicted  nucleic acid-binding Zn-ribbon protein
MRASAVQGWAMQSTLTQREPDAAALELARSLGHQRCDAACNSCARSQRQVAEVQHRTHALEAELAIAKRRYNSLADKLTDKAQEAAGATAALQAANTQIAALQAEAAKAAVSESQDRAVRSNARKRTQQAQRLMAAYKG